MDLFGNTHSHSLYIIGNGFDLAHGMKTSWQDFYNWLKSNSHSSLITFCENNFSLETDLWQDFEKALGEYDLNSIFDYCTEDIEIDEEHMMRTNFIIEDSPDSLFVPHKDELIQCFMEWIANIEISDKPLNIEIPPEAKYLTFNYTETLEKLYHIHPSQILHIHGDVNNPLFGHNQLIKEYWDEHEPLSEQTAKQKIIAGMNELHKDVQGIIADNSDYFDSISDIDEIIIRGISYGPIDLPYFKKIKDSVKPNCLWKLSWHSQKDRLAAKAFTQSLGIEAELFQF